jgi:molybdopterin-guanine dinucleotide biosynthesis protein MobB
VQGLKIPVIAVVGRKRSGKTTTIEILTKELTGRGYRIAAVKHIPESNFTIDKEEKDTWRYAQSGAKTIIIAAADEIATIQKVHIENFSLDDLLEKCRGNDIVFLEGFRKLVAGNKGIPKIVVVKSAEEALEATKTFYPILAFTGPYSTEKMKLGTPYVDILRNPAEIADLVERAVGKQ